VVIERFAEEVPSGDSTRETAVAQYAQAFADRLEHWCRQAPYNWFNFYDFWADGISE
jgi:predicted LPLAT superfamily acyltransferase